MNKYAILLALSIFLVPANALSQSDDIVGQIVDKFLEENPIKLNVEITPRIPERVLPHSPIRSTKIFRIPENTRLLPDDAFDLPNPVN